MRLSVRKDDPGYNIALTVNAKVYLDGVEVKECFTADEETGEVFFYELDEKGRPFVENEVVVEGSATGEVKIVIEEQG